MNKNLIVDEHKPSTDAIFRIVQNKQQENSIRPLFERYCDFLKDHNIQLTFTLMLDIDNITSFLSESTADNKKDLIKQIRARYDELRNPLMFSLLLYFDDMDITFIDKLKTEVVTHLEHRIN